LHWYWHQGRGWSASWAVLAMGASLLQRQVNIRLLTAAVSPAAFHYYLTINLPPYLFTTLVELVMNVLLPLFCCRSKHDVDDDLPAQRAFASSDLETTTFSPILKVHGDVKSQHVFARRQDHPEV
jgi:hypothetical protein